MSTSDFFPKPAPLAAEAIAELTGGRIAGEADGRTIGGVAPLHDARATDLSFLDNPKYLDALAETGAGICLVSENFADRVPQSALAIVVDQPYRAFALVAAKLYPEAANPVGAWSSRDGALAGTVHPEARLEEQVTVEPGAVIGPGTEIGRGTIVCANAVIGRGTRIGRDCYIGPNVTVQHGLIGDRVILHPGVRIGQDGFGFAMGPGGHLKVPQIGRVIVQDGVEIGANSTVDRGANRDTVIGEGTKIDNQVQIAHNVEIGRHCVLVAQSGIAGSSTLEDFVVLAGKAGIAGHLTIGAGAQIAGGSNVAHDVPAGARWAGSPAKPLTDHMRELTRLKKLANRKQPK